MAIMPHYIPWLFDDENAWKSAVSDPRYNYMMPFTNFVALYQEYRTGEAAQFDSAPVAVQATSSSSSESSSGSSGGSSSGDDGGSQILDQSEIDNLIKSMS